MPVDAQAHSYAVTPRTRIKRVSKRAVYDREVVHAVLDEALVCHVGVQLADRVMVQPTLHWRVGEEVFIHGLAKNGLFAGLLGGAEACITVTLMDGLVLARSAFHHSANYRSVMIYGRARLVDDPAEKETVLIAMMDKVAPGRWPEVRGPNVQEMKSTVVLGFALEEVSAKIRRGPPIDDAEDYGLPVWAGVVPLSLVPGEPVQDMATEPPK